MGMMLIPCKILLHNYVKYLLSLGLYYGYGAKVGEVYCGALMYADDLALIAESPDELQAMHA